MPVNVRVAALQLPAHDVEGFAEAWPAIRDRAAEAARAGARLVVLPEGTIPAYVLAGKRYEEGLVERALRDLCELAARERAVLVCGVSRAQGSRHFNAAIVVDSDGSIAGYSDKTFLWHFDRRWFEPSERIEPIATSLGRLGVLVCADGRIPTITRMLVDAGALILVMPTAWVTSGRDPNVLENVQADLLAQVRARENNAPFVAANKCGVERGYVAYCGKSQIVAADGTILELASAHSPETIHASLELRSPAPRRSQALSARDRTPRTQALRIAISPDDAPGDAAEICTILEAEVLLARGAGDQFGRLAELAPAARVGDAELFDPAGLVSLRRAGVQIVVWQPENEDAVWNERFARARALELRIFVVVLDRERAYVADPDGAIAAGTFGSYRIASSVLDLQRTQQTLVAPGSDIVAGLERVAELAERRESR